MFKISGRPSRKICLSEVSAASSWLSKPKPRILKTMPKSKKLQKQIETKLDQLHELLNNIQEVQNIDPHDPDTWDADTLYNLVEKGKEIIKLLEDQPLQGKYDEFGRPLYEDGLCSLVDEYHSQQDD